MDTRDETNQQWRDYKQTRREKKQENKEFSTQLLIDHRVRFESKNFGAHLVITHDDMVVDFWPSTGKWNVRGTPAYHRGVRNLLERLGVRTDATAKRATKVVEGSPRDSNAHEETSGQT